MSFLVVEKPGFLTTVQDLGRPRRAHEGISPSGAADPLAARVANRLVGNTDGAPLLEMTLVGAQVAFHGPAVVAVAGAPMPASADGHAIPPNRAVSLRAGVRLSLGPAPSGARAYLAIRGGLDVPGVLGAAATHVLSGIGSPGRALKAGDMLAFGTAGFERRAPIASPSGALVAFVGPSRADRPLAVTPGPQHDWFTPAAHATFVASTWSVHEHSDRLGIRLAGPALERVAPREMLTEGVTLGAIQVMPDGSPVILFVDQQTTGGYPKIASVAAVDRHRLGQLRPRDAVRFEWIATGEAIERLRRHEARLSELLPTPD